MTPVRKIFKQVIHKAFHRDYFVARENGEIFIRCAAAGCSSRSGGWEIKNEPDKLKQDGSNTRRVQQSGSTVY